MVSWLYKAVRGGGTVLTLSLSLCGYHHEAAAASGFVECIWHITFGSLLSNFCVCFGRHFGFVIYGHVKRSRSWSRAVIPLAPPPSPATSVCAFYGHQDWGLLVLHLTCGCDAGPKKLFTLISSYFFSHFIFWFWFFCFRFLGFPSFFFHSVLFAFQLAIARTEKGLRGAAKVNPMRPQKQIWIFANQAANLRGKRERERERKKERDRERPELPTLALG